MKTFLKSGRRCLSLLLSALLIVSCASIVFAADDHEHVFVETVVEPTCTQRGFTIYACSVEGCGYTYQDNYTDQLGHEYDAGVHQDATCTTPGGTLFTCTRAGCTAAEAEHTKFVENAEEPALGHEMGNWYFTAHPTAADAYCRKVDCIREDCRYFEYELDEDENVNVYFKVSYYTDYALADDAFYTASDGTKLADTSRYFTKKIGEAYVISGGSIDFADTPVDEAYRAPTAECGWYKVTSWSASLDGVTSNVDAHAVYTAKDKYHDVFFLLPGQNPDLAQPIGRILHGNAAIPPADPTKASDKTYNYVFTGWDGDYSKIYSPHVFYAVFEPVERIYKLNYHDKDGNVIKSELFNNGDPALAYPNDIADYSDDSYVYTFTGKWHLSNGADFDLKKLEVPNYCKNEYDASLEADDSIANIMKGIIDVYPTFTKIPKTYPVVINVASENGDVLNGAVVKVFNDAGIIAATATINGTTSVSFNLMSGAYTAEVSYDGEKTTQPFVNSDGGSTVDFSIEIRNYTEEPKECTCFCHVPLFGRLRIMLHNIVFLLTGKKSVCCDDMYSGQYAGKLRYSA